MLGSLTGTVTAHLGSRVLIDVHGVGYWVQTGGWQPEGQTVCYLHHHVREDADDLYGFTDLRTLELFEQLISVSGIGPKAGLAILSLGNSDRVRQAISQSDLSFLSSAPGIGQKAAQKIVLELEKKVGIIGGILPDGQNDVLEALKSLGYKEQDLRPYLDELPTAITLNEQVRWVLQQLGK